MKSRYQPGGAKPAFVVLLAWSLTAFLGWSSPAPPVRPLRVVTTIAPLYCFVQNIAGEAVELSNLLPPNVEPHDYVLSPGDMRRLLDADVVIRNGLGLESFLEAALSKVERSKVIDAAAGILPLPEWVPPGASAGWERPGGAPANPHVWLDPRRAQTEVETIAQELCRRNPPKASEYQAGAERLLAALRRIDDRYRRSLEPLPGKKMVCDHQAFAYLADRYGIEVIAFLDARGHAGLSPKLLAWTMAAIVRERVPALFSEVNRVSPELRSLSRDTGIPIVPLDSMESGALRADLYERAAESNRLSLVRAFQAGSRPLPQEDHGKGSGNRAGG
ncbi:putative Periplasmic solute binding protein for ABC transport system [Methylacidimicrobium sp. AP8]|uniref:metal ABC transporter substrate-binding protein n=1 Tax=Methylacidimicrobium sp. AP8 TaxID=2730359 RepID=UPI0018C135E4|nr:metal ABC transporter substrate-binding protein [Methylacidimicrobium sp. AP8]CAB4243125.1 putative Periplasmic solute binding protein for ABC transport system [Methylacidimicrobium sp. AP8]